MVRICFGVGTRAFIGWLGFVVRVGFGVEPIFEAILTMLILFSFMRIRTHSRNEKSSLDFSNKLRQTLEYKLKVK